MVKMNSFKFGFKSYLSSNRPTKKIINENRTKKFNLDEINTSF